MIRKSIAELAQETKELSDQLFPDRTDASMYLKMYKEMSEVIESRGDADEIADVFILWLDYAARKGVDIQAVVERKNAINSERKWQRMPDGFYQHISSEANNHG